jgi:hypothetical protein
MQDVEIQYQEYIVVMRALTLYAKMPATTTSNKGATPGPAPGLGLLLIFRMVLFLTLTTFYPRAKL